MAVPINFSSHFLPRYFGSQPPSISQDTKQNGSSPNLEGPISLGHFIEDSFKIEVDLPPCCMEFVPEPGTGRIAEYLVVGTYFLEREEDNETETNHEKIQPGEGEDIEANKDEISDQVPAAQNRSGSLNLLRITNHGIKLIQNLIYPLGGILDLHFLPSTQNFIISTSTGALSTFTVTPNTHSTSNLGIYTIVTISTHQIFPKDVLITAFAFSPTATPTHPLLTLTTSTGETHLLLLSQDLKSYHHLNSTQSLLTHADRAWCSAISPTSISPPSQETFSPDSSDEEIKHILYSGGDDFTLNLLPLPSLSPTSFNHLTTHPLFNNTYTSEIYSNHKIHTYGVTALLPLSPTLLLTGSYDEYLRLLQFPNISMKPKVLFEKKIEGGGVWRLKLLEEPKFIQDVEGAGYGGALKFRLLVSGMQAGVRVVDVEGMVGRESRWKVQEMAGVKHENGEICYASDVQPLPEKLAGEPRDQAQTEQGGGKRLIVSSAFYEKLIYSFRY